MPSWIYISNPGKMPGLMGPYSGFEAQRVKDKVEVPCEIFTTISRDPVRAKREIKRKVIEEHGYERGSKRISQAYPIQAAND